MKILMCGDREWKNYSLILKTLKDLIIEFGEVTVVEGEAPGADTLSREAAKALKCEWRPYPAAWKLLGKQAGPARNLEMILRERPLLVIAFHNDLTKSTGTADMVRKAYEHDIPVRIIKEE